MSEKQAENENKNNLSNQHVVHLLEYSPS